MVRKEFPLLMPSQFMLSIVLSSTISIANSMDYYPLKRQSQLQQMTNFATSFLVFDKNKVWYFMRIVCQQTILMKYHALLVIFEKAAKFEIVVCCKLKVALYGLLDCFIWQKSDLGPDYLHQLQVKAKTYSRQPFQLRYQLAVNPFHSNGFSHSYWYSKYGSIHFVF